MTELTVTWYAEVGGGSELIDPASIELNSNWMPLASSSADADTLSFGGEGSTSTAILPVRLSTTSEVRAPQLWVTGSAIGAPLINYNVPNYANFGATGRLVLAAKFDGPDACIADRPRLEAWDSVEDLLNGIPPSNMILTGNQTNGSKSYIRAFDTTPYIFDPSRGSAPITEWWRFATIGADSDNGKALSGVDSYLKAQIDIQPYNGEHSGSDTSPIFYFTLACSVPTRALLADEQNEFVLAMRVFLV